MLRRGQTCLAFIVVCATLAAACASKTPAERVAASRAAYKATLNSFFVKETPLEVAVDEPAGEEAEAAPEPMEQEPMPVPPPVRKDAVLDVIVQHQTSNPLDGITLDITMVDDAKQEIARWRHWVDTSGLPKANQRPYSIVFEDVTYDEGYGFSVEVRSPVPEAERGDYREFEGL